MVGNKGVRKMPGPSSNGAGVQAYVTGVWKLVGSQCKFAQRCFIIGFDVVMVKTQRKMAFTEVGLESQRFQGFGMRLLVPCLDWFIEVVYDAGRCREAGAGKGELGRQFSRLT